MDLSLKFESLAIVVRIQCQGPWLDAPVEFSISEVEGMPSIGFQGTADRFSKVIGNTCQPKRRSPGSDIVKPSEVAIIRA